MIQIIAGEKGQGKTKRLIQMANEEVKTAIGHLVFINNDNRHIYDLHYDIRFVETSNFPIENYKVFFGFLCGVISQDNDIQKIYIDSLTKIIPDLDMEHIEKLLDLMEKFSTEHEVDFALCMNAVISELPPGISKYLV